jgi:phosphoglucosamine mutase
MTQLFGTDGVRGEFGVYPLDRATVSTLGHQLGVLLAATASAPLVVIGGDTRDSTPTISNWLAAGLAAAGARSWNAGTVPTPAVAWLVRAVGASCGIAVSASHNLHPDNGIKLVDADGFKWSRARESELESRIAQHPAGELPRMVANPDPDLARRYQDWLVSTVPAAGLRGLSIVLDTGHGAASRLAEPVFAALGARTLVLNNQPDGRNINRGCGSTAPAVLAAATLAASANLGIAFDGDADRAILADERGEIRDGDAMLFLWARALAARHQLEPPEIVATSMSNLGLERALADLGIAVQRCDVGDRAVVETLRARGLRLGGEQSGHLVDLQLASTGDGLLTGMQIAALVAEARCPLSEMLRPFHRFPQLLRNLRVQRKRPFDDLPGVLLAQRAIERQLGSDGRLVLRYSGTEPLARIMIEGPDRVGIEAMADDLEQALRTALGAA